MQAPNAQGLAGLMPRPQTQPQQPQQPMPSPDRASPMAGLGSVEDRVSAYRGNPAPLQQRYAMSQDLLDLLALQKLKSEKEAAARQMQLSMGQQAAAQGGEPPTIAQQREKEVMDMTKNELAQQRGATANQQVSEQQQAMQRMMSGIAGAPGANAAAQPKMMAAGGIVGYAGPEGSYVEGKKPLDEEAKAALRDAQMQGDRQAVMGVLRKLAAAGYDVATLIPRALAGVADTALVRPARAISGMDIPYLGSVIDTESATPAMDKLKREEAAATPTGAGAGRGTTNPPRVDPNVPMTPPQTGMGKTPPPPPPAPAPQAGLAGLPGAQGAQGAQGAPMEFGTPTDPLAVAGRKASMDAINRDSTQTGLTEEQRVEGRLAFPEEQERRRKMIDEQRQIDEKEFDPERQRREALKRFLIGGGGRAYGELGAGAQASMGYGDAQEKAKAMRRKALEDMEQGIFSLKKGAVEGGIGAGTEARKQAEEGKRAGLGAAANLYGTDVQAKTARENRLSEERRAELSRQVQMAQVQAQRDRNEVDKEFMNQQKLESLKLNHLKSIQDVRQLVGNQYATERDGVAQRLFSTKDPKEVKKLQQRLQEIDTLIEAQVSRDAKDFIATVRKIDGKLSGTGELPPGIKIEEITK